MCEPWQGEQFRANISAPALICFAENFLGGDFWAVGVAHANARAHPTAMIRFINTTPNGGESGLLRQRERPNGSTLRYILQSFPREVPVETTYARQDRDVLLSVMREGNRLSIDARSSLELPHCHAGIRIDRDELTGFLPGEEQSAARG